jgi:hypothetical protein
MPPANSIIVQKTAFCRHNSSNGQCTGVNKTVELCQVLGLEKSG